jgi:hypothetical protein
MWMRTWMTRGSLRGRHVAAYVDDGVAAYVDDGVAAYMDDGVTAYVGIDFLLLSHLSMSRFWKKTNFWSKIISTNKNLNL